jgi:tRNA threonylcarbamoyladenosine biosynthesis protein TsaE
MNIYHGRLEIYHFDFYRLENSEELIELGLDEYFYGEGLTLVEWADKFPDALPSAKLEVTFEKNSQDKDFLRRLLIKPLGGFNYNFMEELRRYASTSY